MGADNSAHSVSAAVSGLAPGTTYHYRFVAVNGNGKVASPDQVFTTAAPAGPSAPTTACRAGFFKKQNKCVKKKHRRKRHHKQRGAEHG